MIHTDIQRHAPGRIHAGLALAAVSAALLVGCEGSGSPTAPNLNPTPATSAEIAGAWTGKFDPADPVDCDGNTPAQASFTRDGESVIGTLSATENGCGFMSVTFQGTLQGNALAGTVIGDRFKNGQARGTLSGATLEINLTSSCPGALCVPGGQLHLHR